MDRVKVIFIGTPKEAVPFFEKLKSNFDLKAVITKPDTIQGRKKELFFSPIKGVALLEKVKVLTPANLEEENFLNEVKELNPDLMILASYSKKISEAFLKIPKRGIICFHPSLLPLYRGATPIQTAILEGKRESGISFFLMDGEFDHGPILYQEKVVIGENETNQDLRIRLFNLGVERIVEIINNYVKGKTEPEEQNHSRATYTKTLTREDGYFEMKESDEKIWKKFKAFYPWPGIWTDWNGKRLKIREASFEKEKFIAKKLQIEGKKEMSLSEFRNGYRDFNLFTEN